MRGKNIIWLSLMAMLLMPIMVNVAIAPTDTAKIYIDPKKIPSSGLGHPGDIFEMAVKVDNIANLWSFAFIVKYEPFGRPLVAGEVREGDFLMQDGWLTDFVYKINVLKGELSIGVTRLIQETEPVGASGSGTLATFKFSVVEAGTSNIELVNISLLDTDLNPISHTAVGSSYRGCTANLFWLIGMFFPDGRRVHVGDSFRVGSIAINNGDSLLQVRTRYDIERLEDGRRIKIYSGQNYAGGGLGEPNPFEYVYASEYIAADPDWGSANDFYGGAGEWSNPEALVGEPDGVYASSTTAGQVAGWYKFHYERAGKVVLNIDLYGYTSQPDNTGNDFDPYIWVPCSDGNWRLAWCDSMGGSVDWAWTGGRYYQGTPNDMPEYYRAGKDARDYDDSFNNMLLLIENYGASGPRMQIDALRMAVELASITPLTPPTFDLKASPWWSKWVAPDPFTINEAKEEMIGTYTITATLEYTLAGAYWMEGTRTITRTFTILP